MSIEYFRRWLENQVQDDVVGIAGSSTKCPLAIFSGLVVFTRSSAPPNNQAHQTPLPLWAIRFINKIDSMDPSGYPLGYKPGEMRKPISITAGQALDVLNELGDFDESD